jgi:hypothetical protein
MHRVFGLVRNRVACPRELWDFEEQAICLWIPHGGSKDCLVGPENIEVSHLQYGLGSRE